jgi:AraC-like DNA-binding protein
MAGTTSDFGTFRISTEDMPEADRIPVWREDFGRLVRLDVEALSDLPFRSDLKMRVLPGLGIISGTHSPFRASRTRKLLADGNDDLVLHFRTGGGIGMQLNREVTVGPRDPILLSNCDIGTFTFPSAGPLVVLSLPRMVLKPLLRDLDAAVLRPASGDNDASQLLESYLNLLLADRALGSPTLRRTVVAHVHDLVALVLGATRDAAELADQRGVRAARLGAIKAAIADGLDRGGDLSVGKIAARHRVTPRYVQMLFEREGTTFTQFVLGERLARAHRMLTRPPTADRSIAAVAFAAGFGDLSYFIRTFRRAYGATPSEVRDRHDKM